MKVLAVLFCAIAAVTATPLFGTEQCANGPGVWCVNIRSAKQCGAVTHCQQTVWNKPVVEGSVPCEVCKEVITVVGNFLKDNTTQAELLALLNKGCDLLPDPALVSQCKELVTDYFNLLINMIEEEISNPSTTCCALGLCKSMEQHLASLKSVELTTNEIPDVDLSRMLSPFLANVPILMKPKEKIDMPAEIGDVCKDCLQLITDVQESLKSNSSFSKMLIDNFLKQCDQLGGGLSEMCKTYINQYADMVVQILIQLTAQEVCCSAGLCTKKASPLIPAKVIVPAMKLQPAIKVAEPKTPEFPENGIATCKICEMVVEKLEKYLEDNRTQEHIKEALEKVCGLLPSKYRTQCDTFVDNYSNLVIAFLETEADPKLICKLMGCCSAREPKIVKLSSADENSQTCEICKTMMIYLDSLLGKNATKQKIEDDLQMVCNYIPQTYLDECHTLIRTYGPLILELLLQEMNPTLVCEKIKCCLTVEKPLLGTEKCMWGPSYWCKDLETAGRCNAIEHCKRHVWN